MSEKIESLHFSSETPQPTQSLFTISNPVTRLGLVLGLGCLSLVFFSVTLSASNQAIAYFLVVTVVSILLAMRDIWPAYLVLVLVYIGVLFDSLGNALGLYGQFSWYDSLTHFFIPASMVLLIAPWIKARWPDLSMLKAGGMAVVLVLAMSSIYEIGEYWMQTVFNMRMIWGELDTGADLQWDLAGALTALVLLVAIDKVKSVQQKKSTG